jgi:hypothetical protein
MRGSFSYVLRRFIIVAAAAVYAMSTVQAQVAHQAYMSAATEPWDDASNLMAMDAAFGSDWTRLNFGDEFQSYALLYIDGGSTTAADMVSFLDTHRAALESYVLGGGRLFINAATENQGTFDLVFGATSTQVDDPLKPLSATAVDPTNELFAGAGASWDGFFFAHNQLAAPDSFNALIVGDTGGTVLAGAFMGDGYVMLGGQTNTSFHQSVNGSDPFQLRVNELLYTLNAMPPVMSAVPEPSVYAMGVLGLIVVLGMTRRQRSGHRDA